MLSFPSNNDNASSSSSEDDEDPYLTQPPSLISTSLRPIAFLDSIRRVIDNESDFNERNRKEYTMPPMPPSIAIPDFISAAIRKDLQVTWGCDSPRPYQIEAIFHLVYRKIDMMYLIRKTGEGKSLVLQGMASMLKGVTISMVPLLGLGSDQEEKCNSVAACAVECYHLDEFRGSHASLLRDHLHKYTRPEKTSIILFLSPQQLARNSVWYKVIMSLATRGCISAVCIDEVHATVHNYESFRPEFKTAMESINSIVSEARTHNPPSFYVPILAMSATFTISDQQLFNVLIGRFPTIVLWGDMSRRSISFNVMIAGDPLHALIKLWTTIATQQPSKQSLIYSNSAAACDGPIMKKLSSARKNVPKNNGKFISLTGDCGMMLKSYLMAAFCEESSKCDEPHNDNYIANTDDNEDHPSFLPRIWCMPCTSAANCGVSSKNCTTCFRLGPPPSWHEMLQEMGRVDRLHNSATGTNSYNIFFNVNTFISLWLRIRSESNVFVRDRLTSDAMDLLRFLILPTRCYHDVLEQHFEHPLTYNTVPTCNNQCSFCNASYKDFCGRVSKSQLIAVLTTRIFDKGNISAISLVSMISSSANKRIKHAIWRGSTSVSPGNVHALVLMLIASNLIHLDVPLPPGTKEFIPLKSVELSLTKQLANDDDAFETYALYIDKNWMHLPIEP